MSADPKAELSRTLALLAGAATSLSVALPAPGDTIARVIATGLGVVGLLLREGASVDEAIAAIRRVRHIDTRADDAVVDAKIDSKPSRDAGIPAKLLRELGTADTTRTWIVPGARVQHGSTGRGVSRGEVLSVDGVSVVVRWEDPDPGHEVTTSHISYLLPPDDERPASPTVPHFAQKGTWGEPGEGD